MDKSRDNKQFKKWQRQICSTFPTPCTVEAYKAKRKTHHWLPPYTHLIQAFGSWADVLTALYGEDTSVVRMGWTKATILEAVKPVIATFDGYPSMTQYTDWRNHHTNLPSIQTIIRNFGSYQGFMIALGQTDYQASKIMDLAETKARLVSYFQNPTHPRTRKGYTQYRKEQDPSLPSLRSIERHFQTWRNLLLELNVTAPKSGRFKQNPATTQLTELECEQFKRLVSTLPQPITSHAYRHARKALPDASQYPTYERMQIAYGGWESVLKAFDLQPTIVVAKRKPLSLFSEEETRQQLLHYLQTEPHPNAARYIQFAIEQNKHQRVQANMREIQRYYGGWEQMLQALGFSLRPKSALRFESTELISFLKKAHQMIGDPFTLERYDEWRKNQEDLLIPSSYTILKYFPSWRQALDSANIQTNYLRNVWNKSITPEQKSLVDFFDWCLS